MFKLDIATEDFSRDVSRMLALTGRGLEEEFAIQVKGVVRTLFKISPPAGTGSSWSAGSKVKSIGAAKKSGFASIGVDLQGGGLGRGNRRVGVFAVISDGLINAALKSGVYENGNVQLFRKKDGTVWGSEKRYFKPNASMSEMRAQHKKYFSGGKMSQAGSYTRDIGRWRWIDRMVVKRSVYNRYLKSQQKKVGWFAAGWKPAANAIGIKPPAYINRHNAPGFAFFDKRIGSLSFTFTNYSSYPSIEVDIKRRVAWAVGVQSKKMQRQIPFLLRRAARNSNFQTF